MIAPKLERPMPTHLFQLFSDRLTPAERRLWRGLTTPLKIQQFLDETPYSTESRYRSPLTVMRERGAHCFDGALFAAAALRRLGHPPLILDLLPGDDDDHILALFKVEDAWGAVAKSNFVGLRYREPVYRTVRELVMTYFEPYFNVKGRRTLRGYTVPLNLAAFDRANWLWEDSALDAIGERLGEIRHIRILSPRQIRRLTPVDDLTYKTGLAIANPAGLYKPK
jgi:hypothetical protein